MYVTWFLDRKLYIIINALYNSLRCTTSQQLHKYVNIKCRFNLKQYKLYYKTIYSCSYVSKFPTKAIFVGRFIEIKLIWSIHKILCNCDSHAVQQATKFLYYNCLRFFFTYNILNTPTYLSTLIVSYTYHNKLFSFFNLYFNKKTI